MGAEQRHRAGHAVLTDSGNFILDVRLNKVIDPSELFVELNTIPGVVENGLFVNLADGVVVGNQDGTSEIRNLPRT